MMTMTRLTAIHVDHHHDEFYHDCPNRGWLRLERLFVFHNDDNDDHHNHRNHDQAECDMWGSLMIMTMTIMMIIVMTFVIQADSNKRGSSPAKSSKGDHCEDCGWQGVQVRLSSFPNYHQHQMIINMMIIIIITIIDIIVTVFSGLKELTTPSPKSSMSGRVGL